VQFSDCRQPDFAWSGTVIALRLLGGAASTIGRAQRQRTAIAHLPNSAKRGCRWQGLTAERAHEEDEMQTAPSPVESDIAAGIPSTRTNAPTKMSRGVRFRASKELGMDKSQAQSVPGRRNADDASTSASAEIQFRSRVLGDSASTPRFMRRWLQFPSSTPGLVSAVVRQAAPGHCFAGHGAPPEHHATGSHRGTGRARSMRHATA
jgi:hypothetical protein